MKKILELAIMDGVSIEIVNDRIILTIDEEKTRRDLWKNQIQFWLSDEKNKIIQNGFLRVENNDKLKLTSK